MSTAVEIRARFEEYLREHEVPFSSEDRFGESGVTSLSFGGGGYSFPHADILVIFDDDGTSAHLVSFRIAQAAGGRVEALRRACNSINERFRWARFYVDDDGEAHMDADAIFNDEICGRVCLEIAGHMAGILDKAYPELMKAVWA